MAATAGATSVYEADTGSTQEADSPFEYKEVLVHLGEVSDATNTATITLANYGITTLKYFDAFLLTNSATTEGPIITREAATTSVTTGVLTVTLPAGSDNCARVFIVGGI
jgi:hypothetical protein